MAVRAESLVTGRRGGVRRLLDRAYRRLGRHYPTAMLVVGVDVISLVFLVSLAVFSLYVDLSTLEFVYLALLSLGLQTFYNAFLHWQMRRLLRPADPWLRGERGAALAERTWEAAASLPLTLVQRSIPAGVVINVTWGVAAVFVLDAPWSYFPLIVLATALSQVYAFALLFLGGELMLRPILEDASCELPDRPAPETRGVPLRWRLLATLPAINVITGVAVAALSREDGADLGDLGIDVAVALAVALTFSLALTVLLSSSIVTPVDQLREASTRVREGELDARVPVLSSDETGALARSFNDMTAGLAERERLRDAFGAFVDPDLAERVLREGTDLAGEEVEVSILFLDVRGFTAMAEHETPREIVATLNRLYEDVVPAITRHGGHANKFVGDGMLAVFGAPERLPDHADRAVAAAIEIAEVVRDRHEVSVGIGVNTGPVLVGTIGGGGRLDFTVIGDPVNTASRVEAATRETGDDLLVTGETVQALTRDFGGFQERPAMDLRGKTEAVSVHAPLRLLDRASS